MNIFSALKSKPTLSPTWMLLLSMSCLQVGYVLSKPLIPELGSAGTACVRLGLSGLFMMAIWRPQWKTYQRQHYLAAGLLGVSIGVATLAVFSSIALIPVALTVTLTFIGPLGIALLDSKRLLDLCWILLSGMGLVLLAPQSGSNLDPVGLGLALFAGICWGGNILLTRRLGRLFTGGEGMGLTLTVASLVLLPFGIEKSAALLRPSVLLVIVPIALLGSALPYLIELEVLRQMPPRMFGVLMSLEPSIAALAGLVLLGEQLDLHSTIALVLVAIAAAGSVYFKPPDKPNKAQPD